MGVNERAKARELFLPWAALLLSGFAWFGSQQLGSNLAFTACEATIPLWHVLIGLLSLALALAGGLLSHRVWRRGEGESEVRRLLALVGMMAAVLLSLAIVLQTVAAFIIPRCAA
jgi:hypothetical protein